MKLSSYENKNYIIENFFVFIFTMLVFKVTPLSLLGDVIGVTIVEIMVFLLLLLYWIVTLGRNDAIKITTVNLLLILMFFISIISCIRVYFGFNPNVKEIFNISLYIIIYTTLNSSVRIYNLNKEYLLNAIKKVIFINIIISIIVYFIPSLFQIFNILFETSKSATIGNTYSRFAGTFANPNFFGIFFSIVSVCIFHMITKNSKKIMLIVSFVASVFLVNISGSRSSLITLLFLLITLFFLNITSEKKKKLAIFAFFICIVATLLVAIIINGSVSFSNLDTSTLLNTRFLNRENIQENFVGRIIMSSNALSEFKKSYLFGIGSSSISTDNQYARILMESGVIMFFLFFTLYIFIFTSSIKKFYSERNKIEKEIYLITLLFTIAYIINMFGAALFSVTQLTSIYFFILALNKKYIKKIEL